MTHSAEDRITPPPESNIPVVPGQIIGDRYLIGEGGMGVVCAATHVGLGTPVAVKLIRADLENGAESLKRFLNEARTAASLTGEHVARVYDVGQLESGEPYLVMERLEGIGLDAYIRARGPLSQREAVDIVLQACEGLAEAHAVALVHRDIKPANLFLARRPDGKFVLKILDFGISKRLLENARLGLTDPGSSLGSPWYMSPEQMKDSSMVDQRADVWSLGVLLFELLTKEWPFSGNSVPQVCVSVLTAPPPVPSARRPDIDPGLDAVVLRCLEKDPDRRYPNVAALAGDLRPFASRPVQSSTLDLDETGFAHGPAPMNDSEGTVESLAPVVSRDGPLRSRFSSMPTVAGLFAAGALLAVFGLSYAREQYRLPGWAEMARAELPWDPELGPDPLEARMTKLEDSWSPMFLPSLTASVSNSAATPTVELDGVLVLGRTPAEIQRSAARSRTWQSDHARLQEADERGSPQGDTPHDEELPNDER